MIKRKIGDLEIKFDSDDHQYYVEDEEVPGVTTITGVIDKSTPLMWWVANSARDYIKDELAPGEALDEIEIDELAEGARLAHKRQGSKATTIGSIVHKFAEDFIQAKINDTEEPDLPVNENAKNSAKQFLVWFSENDIKPIETEQICYNSNQNYAGTYDLLCEIDGDLTVIDFKTSKAIYDEYWLQVTAYLFAARHMSYFEEKDVPEQAGIIRFPKDGEGFEIEIEDDEKRLWRHFWYGFVSARNILRWQQNMT